jgi:ubiquinone/menaquinone biosynthesis C-methylase UbiE
VSDTPEHTDADHDHDHDGHEHRHGHEHDQGIKAMLRYMRFAREMWHSEVNEAVVGQLAPRRGEVVMDIGAGAGAGTMFAAKTGCSVIAVEPTPYMRRVLQLRSLFQKARKRIRIVDGAAEATGVDADSVNAAWAVNTMHHWSNIEAGIGELARVLAPGGRILLVDENFDDPTHPDFDKFTARKEEHSHHFTAVAPDAVAAELSKLGLSVEFAAFDQIAGRPGIIIAASS